MVREHLNRLAAAFAPGGRGAFRVHLGLGLATVAVAALGLWLDARGGAALDASIERAALSGRQEMLVQAIALTASALVATPAPGVEPRLARAVADFDRAAAHLGAGADGSSRLTHLFFESGTLSLQSLGREYLDLARRVLDDPRAATRADLLRISQLAATVLSAQQSEATDAFAARAGAIRSRLSLTQAIVLSALLLLAGTEAATVAMPMRHALGRADQKARLADREILALGTALGLARAESERLRDRLFAVGWSDELTGLMNRGHFHIHLEAEVRRTDEPRPLGVVAFAIDDFRGLNESLGHTQGDAILRLMADRLRGAAPEAAALARTDGNGFALASRFTDGSALWEAAGWLRAALCEPLRLGGRTIHPSVSLGQALAAPADPAERLIGNAEIALGRARGAGPGRSVVFAPLMRSALEEREALIADLHAALDARDFRALLQPQVGLGGAGLLGFELLARWPRDGCGLLTPDCFLPAAAEAGLVPALDRIVLEDGLGALARLRKSGLSIPRVSFNASAESLSRPDFLETLRSSVTLAGLGPADLAIEIGEARLLELGPDAAQDAISHLRWAGFAVEIDGFGSGLANLPMLSGLPVTGVKLDRALVSALPDPGSASVLRALVGLARDLGLNVIAEGVQSSTSLSFLTEIGCHAVQGFGIARPLSEADVRAWMGATGDAATAA